MKDLSAKRGVSHVEELPARTRVVLVEDHPVTRQGLAALISQEPTLNLCGEAETAPAALELIRKLAPDLAIIDLTLAGVSGLELIKSVKASLPNMPILVISMHDENYYAERAIKAGAQGYVMKDEASQNILTAIRSVLQGQLFLSSRMKDKMLHRALNQKTDEVSFSIDSLSKRETEVLQMIGGGLSTREIAAKLGLSEKTIDSYRENLKLKLQLSSGAELVRYAIQWWKSECAV